MFLEWKPCVTESFTWSEEGLLHLESARKELGTSSLMWAGGGVVVKRRWSTMSMHEWKYRVVLPSWGIEQNGLFSVDFCYFKVKWTFLKTPRRTRSTSHTLILNVLPLVQKKMSGLTWVACSSSTHASTNKVVLHIFLVQFIKMTLHIVRNACTMQCMWNE